ncbi:MAG: transposase [Clostridiales bacterium]|nr:transposase [Clostridiales bacterium]
MDMTYEKRKSPRIPGYSYATPNYYFVTICTHNKACIFGKPDELNDFGRLAKANLEKIPDLNSTIQLDKYVVMPNHIHGIFVVTDERTENSPANISTVIGQYKMSVTKEIRRRKPNMQVWQRSFHDHVIRNQKSYEMIWKYIDDNPRKWEEDCFYSTL